MVARFRHEWFLHFSESERAEVDLVLERSDGGLVGIEVKLASRVGAGAVKGLRRLRQLAGSRWLHGVVLAAVPSAFPVEDDVVAAPISALWNFGVSGASGDGP